jgi:hypothetical protein
MQMAPFSCLHWGAHFHCGKMNMLTVLIGIDESE